MIRLFTTAFDEPNSQRRSEYAECLARNIACGEIGQVCLLAEDIVSVAASPKVFVRRIARRPHYTDYISWIAEVAEPDDISLIANADIYFDDLIGVLSLTSIPGRTALALSRWDVSPRGQPRLNDRNDSQDAWAFRGVHKGIFGDFPTGIPRCDNRFVKELELAGYRVLNPSFSVRAYHVHSGAREGYPKEGRDGFVDPPYGYVWPHNLLPLHRAILHNLRNPEYRVGWRLDKRFWARALKLHWITRALSYSPARKSRPAARRKVAEYRASFLPVEGVEPRPQWSVLIPTFNSGQYLGETLRSVLDQDRGIDRMEIIVVDDHSTRDDPESVVKSVAGSRVRFIRQERNVGKVRNFETGIGASRGLLVHQLHGDDRVRPGFYFAMEAAFREFPHAGAFFCESLYIDESDNVTGRTGKERSNTGLLDGWLDRIVIAQRIQTPSIVLRREVYEVLGGFDRRLDMIEDWEMWIRVANSYRVGFVAGVLAEYRVLKSGTSAGAVRSGAVAGHIQEMLKVVDEYLPPEVVERCRSARGREIAQYLTQTIPSLMSAKAFRAVAGIYRDALSFSAHPLVIYRLAYFTARYRALLRAGT